MICFFAFSFFLCIYRWE